MNSDGHRTRTLPLIVVLGVITAFDAMAIDLYLPGFRDIGRSLGANPGTMQTSLSVFVGGAAIGQLFYGPVTDRFGRLGPLAFGILLFVLGSANTISTSTWAAEPESFAASSIFPARVIGGRR